MRSRAVVDEYGKEDCYAAVQPLFLALSVLCSCSRNSREEEGEERKPVFHIAIHPLLPLASHLSAVLAQLSTSD